jgi:hypothetical protein
VERWLEYVAGMKYEQYVKQYMKCAAATIKARYKRMNMHCKVCIFRVWLGDTWTTNRAKAIRRLVLMDLKVCGSRT